MRYAVTETVTMPAYDASGDYALQIFSGEIDINQTNWLEEKGLTVGAQPDTANKTTLSSKTVSISEWDLSEDKAEYTYDVKLDSFPVRRKAVLVPTTADGENESFWGDGSWWDNGEYKFVAGVNPQLGISATVGENMQSKAYELNRSFVNFQEADAAVDGAVMIFPCEDTTGASDSIQIDLQSSVGFYDLQHIKGAGQPHTYLYFLPSSDPATVTIIAQGQTQTVNVTSVRAPAGTYFPGQQIPIIVDFDYPVNDWMNPSGLSMTLSGESLIAQQTGVDGKAHGASSERLVFLYTVPKEGYPISITDRPDEAPAANDTVDLTLNWDGATEDLEGAKTTTNRADAFTGFTLSTSTEEGNNQPQVTVTAELSEVEAYTKWIDEYFTPGTSEIKALYASVDGGKTKYYFTNPGGEGLAEALTVTIPLDYNTNTDGEEDEYQVELWLQGEDGNYRLLLGEGATAVSLTGSKQGEVKFTLVALNGGADTEDAVGGMADAESDPVSLTVGVGEAPYLSISNQGSAVTARQGSDAVVSWSSNLCLKNGITNEGGELTGIKEETTFHISAYYETKDAGGDSGTHRVDINLAALGLDTLTTSAENPSISSVTLPREGLLDKLYETGVREITVQVYADYEGKRYGTYEKDDLPDDIVEGDTGKRAAATVTMVSQPASVALEQPEDGLYQTDGVETIGLTWTMSNLDVENGGQFELYVASTNAEFHSGQPLSVTELGKVADNGDGSYNYTLEIPRVVLTDDPNSYRDAYTVTVKAKNQAETTWSSSSYVLYVYSTDALDILVDGERRDTLLMSNEDKIAGLWEEGGSAANLAHHPLLGISINYGEYAWAELADQIQWNSTDSSVASVNYQQGGLYENIERFSYTSYRPATDFVLSGLSDGSTTVTAQHSQADLSTSLEVTVETLRDKLYLFQCYPINTVTTLTYEEYTDESRTQTVTRTVDTNEQGEAAVYAPYGIAGDVYCQSETKEGKDTVTWMGTFYHYTPTATTPSRWRRGTTTSNMSRSSPGWRRTLSCSCAIRTRPPPAGTPPPTAMERRRACPASPAARCPTSATWAGCPTSAAEAAAECPASAAEAAACPAAWA